MRVIKVVGVWGVIYDFNFLILFLLSRYLSLSFLYPFSCFFLFNIFACFDYLHTILTVSVCNRLQLFKGLHPKCRSRGGARVSQFGPFEVSCALCSVTSAVSDGTSIDRPGDFSLVLS
jgi:hypothetical protein